MVADGGADLEHFELRTFEEVRSILLQASWRQRGNGKRARLRASCAVGLLLHMCVMLWEVGAVWPAALPQWALPTAHVLSHHPQTALAVAVAEEACQFEHRDLHWGNLLIRRSEQPAATAAVGARLRGVDLEAGTSGVTVSGQGRFTQVLRAREERAPGRVPDSDRHGVQMWNCCFLFIAYLFCSLHPAGHAD